MQKQNIYKLSPTKNLAFIYWASRSHKTLSVQTNRAGKQTSPIKHGLKPKNISEAIPLHSVVNNSGRDISIQPKELGYLQALI